MSKINESTQIMDSPTTNTKRPLTKTIKKEIDIDNSISSPKKSDYSKTIDNDQSLNPLNVPTSKEKQKSLLSLPKKEDTKPKPKKSDIPPIDSGSKKISLHFNSNKDDPKIKEQNDTFEDNTITTTKYNVFTWLPKSLLLQFTLVANVYFLFITILTCMWFSPKNPYIQAVTFVSVLVFTMCKEAYEDFKRYKQDKEINERKTEIYNSATKDFIESQWFKISVGDIVKVKNLDQIPCDLLIIKSSMESGLAFVDTKNLDGETNLKEKLIPPSFKTLKLEELDKINGVMQCDSPNEYLDAWEGNLSVPEMNILASFTVKQLVLKGCALKNTEYIWGICVYNGHNVKIMKNSKAVPNKKSNMSKVMNWLLLTVFVFQCVICVVFAVGCVMFINTESKNLKVYLPVPTNSEDSTDIYIFFIKFLTFMVAYSPLIPISLYVAMQVVKMFQGSFILYDDLIYDYELDKPSIARTSDLIEELGQVEFIFSDKTGTLTQNLMEFRKCCINSKIYGSLLEYKETASSLKKGNYSVNGDITPSNILNSVVDSTDKQEIFKFFMLTATCHSAVTEEDEKNPEIIKYNSSSPDEVALIIGAKKMGFEFVGKTTDSIKVMDLRSRTLFTWTLIVEIPFDSTRKRMSVIVKSDDGKIFVMTKGADNIILPLCSFPKNDPKNEQTKIAETLYDFSCEGLRTLVMAQKEVDQDFFDVWYKKFETTNFSIDADKEERLNRLYEEVEKNLTFVGCSAIEDKLQDNISDTIFTLLKANIRIWVLTGDKKETALNIGKTCKLIEEIGQNEFDLTFDETLVNNANYQKRLTQILKDIETVFEIDKEEDIEKIKNMFVAENYYLIVDGTNLVFILANEEIARIFFRVALLCRSVICCRVSPKQKSQVVQLSKTMGPWICLSIGDGANDVPMIMEANIGVGIQGKEGTQAVRSSDYAISQFRFLKRLILVHGRLGYSRIAGFICYYFYKNVILVFVEIYFVFFNGYSGQPYFPDFLPTLYNAVWSTWPGIATFGIERDVDDTKEIFYPSLYKAGQAGYYFNLKVFWKWLFFAWTHGAFVYFTTLLGVKFEATFNGKTVDHWWMSTMSFTLVFHIIMYKIYVETYSWNKFNLAVFFFHLVLYYVCLLLINSTWISYMFQPEMPHIVFDAFVTLRFWVIVAVLPFLALLPDVGYRFLMRIASPSPLEVLLLDQGFYPPSLLGPELEKKVVPEEKEIEMLEIKTKDKNDKNDKADKSDNISKNDDRSRSRSKKLKPSLKKPSNTNLKDVMSSPYKKEKNVSFNKEIILDRNKNKSVERKI